MCGRYTLSDPGDLLTELGVDGQLPLVPRYNVAPTQELPVVRAAPGGRRGKDGDGGGRELALLRWGLIPSWAQEASIGNRMINARSESAAEKPSFKSALKQRRCLILADGFFEWAKVGTAKQPYHIFLKDHRPFTFAGLWERWTRGPEGPIESFTILTTDANAKIRPLHDRMPVILPAEKRDVWLDPSVTDPARLTPLLTPYADDEIAYAPVSRIVNNPKNDVPQCIEPIA